MEAVKKILIVDDEKFVTDALEGFFHSKGYKIFKAEDGEACTNIIKSEKLDLVLLDIKLPKISGIEILKLLRKDYPSVKVIVMTAYDMEYKAKVDSIGCDAFFIKPLLIDELTVKVEEILSKEKGPVPEAAYKIPAETLQKPPIVISESFLPKARLLIISPRDLISGLVKDYFTQEALSKGIYDVIESGLGQIERIKEFKPDIILLDVAFIGMLGEFGLNLLRMTHPPKEIILFGDPAEKWEEAEGLIKRGIKFIEIPADLHNEAYPIKETIQRLNDAVREVCARYHLCREE
ncbi:MAG: hypothetical protein DRP74_05065 [Candidatus Omnitrophota bacterium]|mgnify:CR=1 FL=1|nr:MAG: hypothetical protein DRP74_05065 [Candidatus Omnitrophota bacterium]